MTVGSEETLSLSLSLQTCSQETCQHLYISLSFLTVQVLQRNDNGTVENYVSLWIDYREFSFNKQELNLHLYYTYLQEKW